MVEPAPLCVGSVLETSQLANLVSLATQKTSNLTGENMEATYSLVSSAVELLELRQQLVAAELRQGAPPVATHRLAVR